MQRDSEPPADLLHAAAEDAAAAAPHVLPDSVAHLHLIPLLDAACLRAYARACKAYSRQVRGAVTRISRRQGTAWLPRSLSTYSRLRCLDLAHSSDITGGVELVCALQTLSCLTSLVGEARA